VLKDEIAQAHAKVDLPEKHKHHEPSVAQLQAMEQTILKLKRVVEKLQVENKYLKGNSTRSHGSSTSSITTAAYMSQNDRKKEETFEKLKSDYEKLQKNYADALNKISALQIELELSQAQSINVSCPHCNKKNLDELPTQDIDVLQQQLQQKTALLDRARLLLQRAAGKEKHLVEKINYLKKRVSELEGVPFISEENSESG
jgi:predicted RNase H-like nuclease (RuvC/YqgF family)